MVESLMKRAADLLPRIATPIAVVAIVGLFGMHVSDKLQDERIATLQKRVDELPPPVLLEKVEALDTRVKEVEIGVARILAIVESR
jgi:hypothetical protein